MDSVLALESSGSGDGAAATLQVTPLSQSHKVGRRHEEVAKVSPLQGNGHQGLRDSAPWSKLTLRERRTQHLPGNSPPSVHNQGVERHSTEESRESLDQARGCGKVNSVPHDCCEGQCPHWRPLAGLGQTHCTAPQLCSPSSRVLGNLLPGI